MVSQWSKAKDLQASVAVKKWSIDYTHGKKLELADYTHGQEMDRIKHKTAMGLAAESAGAAIQHHYNTAMEGIKTSELDKRNTRQNELDTQLEQAKHLNKTAQQDQDTAGKIKLAQKTAATARATKKHGNLTDLNSMKALSKSLSEGTVSPFVAGPNTLQNIGPGLTPHINTFFPAAGAAGNTNMQTTNPNPGTQPPTSKVSKKRTPKPPTTPVGATPNPSGPVVTPAKVKSQTQPKRRGRTATVGGGLTEVTPDSIKTGKRGSM
jgi:hypothetical protein